MNGADIIEKHIMHSYHQTDYDYFSSSTYDDFLDYEKKIRKHLKQNKKSYVNLKNRNFIIKNEKQYLQNSILTQFFQKI